MSVNIHYYYYYYVYMCYVQFALNSEQGEHKAPFIGFRPNMTSVVDWA